MSTSRAIALGIDLGSTAIKVGVLGTDGRLSDVRSVSAPRVRGEGHIRESDAEAYFTAAHGLLRAVSESLPSGIPLGLATQRSSFTIWDRASGRPLLPLISWQDRRAAGWCDRHRPIEPEIVRRTGLLLSAHYLAPKLASMLEHDQSLRETLESGRYALGTLESYAMSRWSAGAHHATDLTVAARTLLVDLDDEDWSADLLRYFGVPRAVLPDLVASTGRDLGLVDGPCLDVTISDQAAAALPVLDPDGSSCLVNLGTGAFVLVPAERGDARKRGYLFAPILAAGGGERRYAFEGTVNGAGPAVDRFGPGPTAILGDDPSPEGFAIPDRSGLGSPWWRPEIGLSLSPAAERLDDAGRRRVVLEGVLFRIRGILADLTRNAPPDRIIVAGGLIRDPAVGPALAVLLGRPVELLLERESGLLGASRLAAGLAPYADPATTTVAPGAIGAYLPDKFSRWKTWLDAEIAR